MIILFKGLELFKLFFSSRDVSTYFFETRFKISLISIFCQRIDYDEISAISVVQRYFKPCDILNLALKMLYFSFDHSIINRMLWKFVAFS